MTTPLWSKNCRYKGKAHSVCNHAHQIDRDCSTQPLRDSEAESRLHLFWSYCHPELVTPCLGSSQSVSIIHRVRCRPIGSLKDTVPLYEFREPCLLFLNRNRFGQHYPRSCPKRQKMKLCKITGRFFEWCTVNVELALQFLPVRLHSCCKGWFECWIL